MIRMARFAKYLIRAGHSITVLTKGAPEGNLTWDFKEPELYKVKIYKVPVIQKNSVKDRINPQLEIAWFYSVKDKLNTLLEGMACDVIVSSSPPESAHLIAYEIKKRIKKPWIADLRDLWSLDHYRGFGPIRRKPLEWEEKKILKQADKIVTVTDGWGEFLKKGYGNDRVRVITNAFDEDWYKDKFRISYLGKLNEKHQEIIPFLDSIKTIVKSGNIPRENLQVDFYVSGYGKPDIKKLALERDLEDVVHEYEPVPIGKAIDIMKSSHLLLLVGWKGMSSQGWRPQKVYEYIGSRTPILFVNHSENAELRNLIRSANAGTLAGPLGINTIILRYYRDFRILIESRGEVKKTTVEHNKCNAKNVTDRLISLIEELCV
jgi:glycosyltransferase involved in cell wall biosynthesis